VRTRSWARAGTPETYTIKDTLAKPGVTCRFEDRVNHIDEQLDRVSARSLQVRGHKPFLTWVGYRFRVYQRAALETDYELVFKSALTKRRASTTDPASFPARSWSPPEGLPASDFRVIIDLVWFTAGSKSQPRGARSEASSRYTDTCTRPRPHSESAALAMAASASTTSGRSSVGSRSQSPSSLLNIRDIPGGVV
jgi:hypothetical protein